MAPHPPATQSLIRDGIIGRLTIPRLHLHVMVREGDSETTLRLAVGHIPGTALPWELGNVGVAGHRDTFFRALRKISTADHIVFETLAGSYVYQVEGTEIVKPEDLSVLGPRSYPELTLVTCYPFYYVGSAPERFVVRARQLPKDPSAQQPPQLVATSPTQTSVEHRTGSPRITFQVTQGHSRQVSPEISFGLVGTECSSRRLNGWIWFAPDRRTVWLRHHSMQEPVIIYDHLHGRPHRLVITAVTANSAKGYLVEPVRAEDLARSGHYEPAATVASAKHGGSRYR